ncbi:reverse transcriptase domain-containing protein [Tanacetum coccineum]
MNMPASAILEDALPPKEKDPGSFTIPCYINNICFEKSLADLGASVSVMPYSTFTNIGLCELTPTKLIIELVDRTIKRPKGIAENVLVGAFASKLMAQISSNELSTSSSFSFRITHVDLVRRIRRLEKKLPGLKRSS